MNRQPPSRRHLAALLAIFTLAALPAAALVLHQGGRDMPAKRVK